MQNDRVQIVAESDEYRFYRQWYTRETKPQGSGCFSSLVVPLATAGCVLATMLCSGVL